MKFLISILISFGFCNSILDNWIEEKRLLLEKSPIKIEGDLIIQNEFSEQESYIELNIKNEKIFWVNTGKKKIFYSENWTKIFDPHTNQLIIDVPDLILIQNFYKILIEKSIAFDSKCSREQDINCDVKISQFNLFLNAKFDLQDSSLLQISHHFKTSSTTVKKIKVSSLQNNDDEFWNPNFEDSFIIDLRP